LLLIVPTCSRVKSDGEEGEGERGRGRREQKEGVMMREGKERGGKRERGM
jgi:hypothetical protein